MSDQFFSPNGDLEDYFVSEYWLIDQYISDELYVWGNGADGRLGNASTTNRSAPVEISTGGNWQQVSSKYSVTAAIDTNGRLWTWGVLYENAKYGSLGSIGDNTRTSSSTPVTTFAGGTNWKQVSCGQLHTAAIKTDGTLWTWGSAFEGQLGNLRESVVVVTPVTTFSGGTNWKQVSCGQDHTAAIKTDGTLWVWGNGIEGQLGIKNTNSKSIPVTTFAGGNNWTQVSCGQDHTAAIKTDGTLWTWGNGIEGQLGKNSNALRSLTPITTFSGGTGWQSPATPGEDVPYTLSSGGFYTSAIKTDGTLWTWGNGSVGQLGNSDLINIFTPITTFAGGTNWAHVSVGSNHTAAVKTDGTLWTWGNGIRGQLGNAAITNRSTPVTTSAGGTNWAQVSCGSIHTAAIKTDGRLWTWGLGSYGQLGNASTTARSTPVTTFAGGTNWKQVSCGEVHTAAIKTDGTLWTWGNGLDGQLGNGLSGGRSTPSTTFAGGINWAQVSCGGRHTVAIKTDGTLWTWGNGTFGRLGNASTTARATPVTTFAGGINWAQVSGGYGSTSAIKTDGTLWTWGLGSDGQLGNGSTINTSTPVTTFAGGTNWRQVSCGGRHTAVLNSSNQLYVFGNGSSGQLGENPDLSSIIPGQTFQPTTDWKQVSCGQNHTAAIKTNRTLWTWGNGSYGRLGNASTINVSTPVTTFAGGTNWKQVGCGGRHTLAIKTDGTLWTWGRGNDGQLGNAVTTSASTPVTTRAGGTNWKQVSGGADHTAAVLSGISAEYPLS